MVVLKSALLAASVAAAVQKEAITVGSLTRHYEVQYPSGNIPENGWPMVFGFHGWRSSASAEASSDGFRIKGSSTAIVVHGEGYSDPTNPGSAGDDGWPSWNGGGSSGAESGGTDGPICNPSKVSSSGWQCYKSCEAKGYCTQSGGGDHCRWSHCEDDVAFVLAVLDAVKNEVKVDSSRIFASGHSNGAMFIYELASDPRSASVFAALAPSSGWPHNGFNRGTPNSKLRFLNFAGTQDTYIYPFPNVASDPTKSYGADYGWYYSAWDNTTNLWAAQRGFGSITDSLSVSQSGLDCKGWSAEGSAEGADIATCFYNGGHGSPSYVYDVSWTFFGIDASPAPPPAGNCPKTCEGYTCDEWYDYNGATCANEEQNYGCDCSGCECKGGFETVV